MIKCENACPRGKFDGCCHKCPDFHTCPDSCQENPNACGSATFDEETALQAVSYTHLPGSSPRFHQGPVAGAETG